MAQKWRELFLTVQHSRTLFQQLKDHAFSLDSHSQCVILSILLGFLKNTAELFLIFRRQNKANFW